MAYGMPILETRSSHFPPLCLLPCSDVRMGGGHDRSRHARVIHPQARFTAQTQGVWCHLCRGWVERQKRPTIEAKETYYKSRLGGVATRPQKNIEHDFVFTGDAEAVRARMLLVCDCCVGYGSDPDHGSKWSLEQAVVSFGEVRRFNLKRIQGAEGASSAEKRAQDAEPEHSFHVRNGDVVHMFADCQDKFLHSVSKAQGVRLLLAQS